MDTVVTLVSESGFCLEDSEYCSLLGRDGCLAVYRDMVLVRPLYWQTATGEPGRDPAVIAYFGDGAMSQRDVNEAFVFAASFQVPVVFFCQNNHWAISEPWICGR